MKWDRNTVETGMLVTSEAGERIGKIIRADDEVTFVVEKGTFFPKDYQLRYDHITGVSEDGTLLYSLAETPESEPLMEEREPLTAGREPLTSRMADSRADTEREPLTTRAGNALRGGAGAVAAAGARAVGAAKSAGTPAREPREATLPREVAFKEATLREERAVEAASLKMDTEERGREQEVRIPLLEEELDVETFAYESGRVKIHKTVSVEDRHFSVPVRREELVVEHVPSKDRSSPLSMDASATRGAFEDQTMDIPLYEEDIRVGKHPVLREEVIIRTVAHYEDVEGSASLRSEDADIQDTRDDRVSGYAAAARNTAAARDATGGYGAPARH